MIVGRLPATDHCEPAECPARALPIAGSRGLTANPRKPTGFGVLDGMVRDLLTTPFPPSFLIVLIFDETRTPLLAARREHWGACLSRQVCVVVESPTRDLGFPLNPERLSPS